MLRKENMRKREERVCECEREGEGEGGKKRKDNATRSARLRVRVINGDISLKTFLSPPKVKVRRFAQ